jgi:hypothetical protein
MKPIAVPTVPWRGPCSIVSCVESLEGVFQGIHHHHHWCSQSLKCRVECDDYLKTLLRLFFSGMSISADVKHNMYT